MNYSSDRMRRASGWGIRAPEPLIGVFARVCSFPLSWQGNRGVPPPLHPASGGSSWVRGRCSITLLQESGSWVWDCGITGRQAGVCRAALLSVMFRPPPSPPQPRPLPSVEKKGKTHTHTHTSTTTDGYTNIHKPVSLRQFRTDPQCTISVWVIERWKYHGPTP